MAVQGPAFLTAMWLVSILGIVSAGGNAGLDIPLPDPPSLLPPIKEACFNVKTMDSYGYVMIEKDVLLPQDRMFTGIFTTLCTHEPVHIQIWRRNFTSDTYQLRLDMDITTMWRTGRTAEPFMFEGGAISFTPEDRLGLYIPETFRLPIPYAPCKDLSENGKAGMYMSTRRFPHTYEFVELEDEVSLQETKWKRCFRPFIALCQNKRCNLKNGLWPLSTDTITNLIGHKPDLFGAALVADLPQEPAPPGGPETSNPAPPVPDFTVKCENPDLTENIIEVGSLISELQKVTDRMQEQMRNLTNTTVVTGICPIHMVPGDEIGSCYIIQPEKLTMASAQVSCRDNHNGHLVAINTEREERFLREEITKRALSFASREKDLSAHFWTSGMYSFNNPRPDWYWFNEPKWVEDVTYTNWRPGSNLLPRKPSRKICISLAVDTAAPSSIWDVSDCQKYKYYICELPKRCL